MSAERIDDRSNAIIYDGAWSQSTSQNAHSQTMSGTMSALSRATIQFTGSRIVAYGALTIQGLLSDPVSSWTLDGRAPVQYTAPRTPEMQYIVPMFDSGVISEGQHTLVFAPTTNETLQFLDYFDVYPDPPPTQQPILTSITSSTIINHPESLSSSTPADRVASPLAAEETLASTTAFESIAPTGDSRPLAFTSGAVEVQSLASNSTFVTGSDSGHNALDGSIVEDHPNEAGATRRFPVGAVVGAVVGFVALLVLAIILLLLRKRAKSKRQAAVCASSGGIADKKEAATGDMTYTRSPRRSRFNRRSAGGATTMRPYSGTFDPFASIPPNLSLTHTPSHSESAPAYPFAAPTSQIASDAKHGGYPPEKVSGPDPEKAQWQWQPAPDPIDRADAYPPNASVYPPKREGYDEEKGAPPPRYHE